MMNAGLQRRLRTCAMVVAGGAIAGLAFNVSQGRLALVGMTYGISMSGTLAAIELFFLDGSMRPLAQRLFFHDQLPHQERHLLRYNSHSPMASAWRTCRGSPAHHV
jgi:hypothetical protein